MQYNRLLLLPRRGNNTDFVRPSVDIPQLVADFRNNHRMTGNFPFLDLDAAFLEYGAQADHCPRTVEAADVLILALCKKRRESPTAGRYAHEFCVAAHKLFLP